VVRAAPPFPLPARTAALCNNSKEESLVVVVRFAVKLVTCLSLLSNNTFFAESKQRDHFEQIFTI